MTVRASLPMRWCSALAVATAAVVAAAPQAAAEAFPVTARLLGGPHTYTAGAGPREFRVELENTSRERLRNVHPVLVFVDRGRRLTAGQILLEYRVADPVAKAGNARDRSWRPVAVRHTDNDENIAVVGGEDGPGTTLPSRRKVSIALRLRFTAPAPAGPVTASATIMERRGEDGDWVGESEGYDFDVVPSRGATAGPQSPRPGRTGEEERPDGAEGGDGGTGTGPGEGPGTRPGGSPAPDPSAGTGPGTEAEAGPQAGPGTGPGTGPGADPGAGPVPGKGRETAPGAAPGAAPGLAATGDPHRAPALMLTGAGVLVVVGGAALRFSRRG
ncbi:hypothetical protein OIE69_25060 [Actinacidiphila glaucinigra]|uniref:hypothetical protein n=1 Tax=Actinacidiphila glaucinigra TaxID=235986 RepID=UPI002DDA73F5|nr:hypothetical protein [Actinacidiphila glaucinigra]WSD61930.1 hypothetical protein OIE69_25060 [Actinacidiphila glaucinigra]